MIYEYFCTLCYLFAKHEHMLTQVVIIKNPRNVAFTPIEKLNNERKIRSKANTLAICSYDTREDIDVFQTQKNIQYSLQFLPSLREDAKDNLDNIRTYFIKSRENKDGKEGTIPDFIDAF